MSAVESEQQLYALLACWYDGDGYPHINSLLGIFTSIERAKKEVEEDKEAQNLLTGELTSADWDDDKVYYRIVPVALNKCTNYDL